MNKQIIKDKVKYFGCDVHRTYYINNSDAIYHGEVKFFMSGVLIETRNYWHGVRHGITISHTDHITRYYRNGVLLLEQYNNKLIFNIK
jgi:hypothetical protein